MTSVFLFYTPQKMTLSGVGYISEINDHTKFWGSTLN